MAINYLGKLAETSSPADPKSVTLGIAVPAGSLIILAINGRRSSASPAVISVTDTNGHTYTKSTVAGSTCMAGLAWTRTVSSMTTSDQITVDLNAVFSEMWISAHAFENAAGAATDTTVGATTDSTPQATLDVSGSDWLTFMSVFYFPQLLPTITPVNSSLSRDTSSASECFSRNGTTGTTHTIGGTTAVSYAHYISAASFAFETSGGSGNIRGQKTLIGV